jgi:hypothetical protein
MKKQYQLNIASAHCTARYKITYNKGVFHSLEKLTGKVTDQQHKYLINFVPLLESVIHILNMEWNKKGITWSEIEKKTPVTLLKQVLDIYYTWYKDKLGIVPKINGTENNALKEIIKHIGRMSQNEAEIINTWGVILSNWDMLPEFYQNQTELRQINQNLNIILRTIKEHGGQGKYTR